MVVNTWEGHAIARKGIYATLTRVVGQFHPVCRENGAGETRHRVPHRS